MKNYLITLAISVLLFGCTSAKQRHAHDRDKNIQEAEQSDNEVKVPIEQEQVQHVQKITLFEIPQLVELRTEQILQHIGYTVSYNPNWGIPNWVAYELTNSEVNGTYSRSNDFAPDPLLLDPVFEYEYKGSGYDRGHMAPAADMKWSEQAMSESFYMTNMCPQNHNLNSKDWERLEEHVRYMARLYDHIFICCGPIVTDTTETIGCEHKIVVPQSFYKVLLRKTSDSWAAIGFVMANKPRDGKWNLDHYAMPINDIEKLTGIDFFHSLPDNLEEEIESCYSLDDWNL